MERRVIRSIDDTVELILEDGDLFWNMGGKRATNQLGLFKTYGSEFRKVVTKVKNFDKDMMYQTKLADLTGLSINQLENYFNVARPELHPVKRAPLTMESVYETIIDFMPVIEGWQDSKGIANELSICSSTVNHYCIRGLIEHGHVLNKYFVSPVGVDTLKVLLHIGHASIRNGWKTANEAAEILGVCKASVAIHCADPEVGAEKYGRRWRIPENKINVLGRNIKRVENSFVFCGETYYHLAAVMEEAAGERGVVDPEEKHKLLARFYHLREFYPEVIPSIKKNKTHYVDEKRKTLLKDLMPQIEAQRALGLCKDRVRVLMKRGVVDKVVIGPTSWTTYSSVMRQKEASNK